MPLRRLFILFIMSALTLHATDFGDGQKPVSLDVSLPLEMKQGSSFAFAVQATFDDDSVRVVDANVTSGNPDVIGIDVNQSLLALDEGNATVTVSYEDLTVQQLISVYFEIHGHRLPPEPDPEVNNATLLGVDSNDNGVRDDVERWLLKRYKGHHAIVTEVAMQGARAWQIVLNDSSNARETAKYVHRAMDCESYYRNWAEYYGEKNVINEKVTRKILNTEPLAN